MTVECKKEELQHLKYIIYLYFILREKIEDATMMTFLQVTYRQDKTTAVCLQKYTSAYYLEKENAYLGNQKHESVWKIANCSDVVLHMENAQGKCTLQSGNKLVIECN